MYKSRRFCLSCYKVTTFKHKAKEQHSRCEICGGFLATQRKDKAVKRGGRRKKFLDPKDGGLTQGLKKRWKKKMRLKG